MTFINQLIPSWIPKTLLFFSILFVSLLFTHWELVRQDPLLSYDDKAVVAPMENIKTINEYIIKINNGEIFDRQPVRDLSFWFDYQIKQYFSLSIHHFHNLIIWLGIAILLYSILRLENIQRKTAAFVVTLFAFHPCLTNAVSWITARKHLLSTFFILAATAVFIKTFQKKSPELSLVSLLAIPVLYFLSCFSQPINIAWPLWVVFFLYFNYSKDVSFNKTFQMRILILAGLLFAVLVVTSVINNNYYTSTYMWQSEGNNKYIAGEPNNFSYKILALGAYFFQMVLPLWPTPSSYYPGSDRNIIGMVLLVLFAFFLYKMSMIKKRKPVWIWGIFALLPLLVVNIRMTNIFGSDTYLLIPIIGIYIASSQILTSQKWIYAILIPVLIFFIYNSRDVSKSWASDKELWIYAQKNQETPIVLRNLAQIYMLEKNYNKSFELGVRLLEWNPAVNGFDIVFANSLYNLHNIGVEDKISWFKKGLEQIPNAPYMNYFISALYVQQGKWEEALQHMSNITLNDYKYFKNNISKIAADYTYMCFKASKGKPERCTDISSRIKARHRSLWNEIEYQAKLSMLLKNHKTRRE